jgi:O-antigen biosynthesis protein WbqP
MIRTFDIFIAIFGLTICLPFLSSVLILGWLLGQHPLYHQQRVGRYLRPFTIFKLRTMQLDTPSLPTHLADTSAVTFFGNFLRRTKLDELPQLWNVLIGDMSVVGPRPCLFSQSELINERDARGVFTVRPGLTGLAQVKGVDMSTPRELAEVDAEMVSALSLKNYFLYIIKTFGVVVILPLVKGDRK